MMIQDTTVAPEEMVPGTEDDDVIGRGGQHEEGQLELEADPEEYSARDQSQQTAVHRVLEEVGESR